MWQIDFQKTLFLSQSFFPSGQGNDSASRDIQRKEPWSRFSKVDFQVSSRGRRWYQHLSFSQKLKFNRLNQTFVISKLMNLTSLLYHTFRKQSKFQKVYFRSRIEKKCSYYFKEISSIIAGQKTKYFLRDWKVSLAIWGILTLKDNRKVLQLNNRL